MNKEKKKMATYKRQPTLIHSTLSTFNRQFEPYNRAQKSFILQFNRITIRFNYVDKFVESLGW